MRYSVIKAARGCGLAGRIRVEVVGEEDGRRRRVLAGADIEGCDELCSEVSKKRAALLALQHGRNSERHHVVHRWRVPPVEERDLH